MKVTPINFSVLLEPKLIQFWEEKPESKNVSIQIKRSHNFRLRHTELTCVAVDQQENTTILGQILLVEIPQQEQNASLNCMIHLPDVQTPSQLLMVFKTEEDSAQWVRRIITRIRNLMEAQAKRKDFEETAAAAQQVKEAVAEPETEEPSPESDEEIGSEKEE